MTVQTEATFAGPYSPNGATTVFPFFFAARSSDEVLVSIDGVVINSSLYTVTLNADFNKGAVIFDTAPVGSALIVASDPMFTQGTSIGNQAAFLPKTIEEALDRAAIRDNWLKARTASADLPIGSVVDALGLSSANAPSQRAVAAALAGLPSLDLLQSAVGSENIGHKPTPFSIVQSLSKYLKDYNTLRGYVEEATVRNGHTDIAPSIQKMADEIAGNGGGLGNLMPFDMLIDSPVLFPANVRLDGRSTQESPISGASFWRSKASFTPFSFPYGVFGGGISGVLFHEDQPNFTRAGARGTTPTGWAPNVYPEWIVCGGSTGQRFDDLTFFGCYKGLVFGGPGAPYTAGRQNMHRVRGDFFGVGVEFRYCLDTPSMTDCHFYPYAAGNDPNIHIWCYNNATALLFKRADSPMVNNSFFGNYNRVFDFESSADGASTGGQFSNIEMDFSRVGVFVNVGGIHHQIANLRIQPDPGTTLTGTAVEYGLQIAPGVVGSTILMSAPVISHTSAEAIKIEGTNNTVSMSNALIANYADVDATKYAIYAAAGNFVKDYGTIFDSANARYRTGGGTFVNF